MAIDRNWQRISWLILGIGSLILAGGLALAWDSLRHVLYAERTEGEVVDVRREDDMYSPVVRFRLPDGTPQEVTDLGSGAPDFAVGDRVTVLYMPDDPQNFLLGTFERLWFSPITVIGFAGFWLMFGAVAWALSRDVELFVLGERAFSVIAVGALVVGGLVLWNATELYRSGARAEGTVVEIRDTQRTEQETVTRSDGSEHSRTVERVYHTPIVRFTAQDDRGYDFHARSGSDSRFAVGERVTVVYDPSHPMRAYVVSFVDLWLPSVVAFAVAILFGGAVLLSRWSRRRVAP